jgi:hypothetical protein
VDIHSGDIESSEEGLLNAVRHMAESQAPQGNEAGA